MSAEIENAATFSKTRKVFRIKAAFTFLFLSIVKTPKTKKNTKYGLSFYKILSI